MVGSWATDFAGSGAGAVVVSFVGASFSQAITKDKRAKDRMGRWIRFVMTPPKCASTHGARRPSVRPPAGKHKRQLGAFSRQKIARCVARRPNRAASSAVPD